MWGCDSWTGRRVCMEGTPGVRNVFFRALDGVEKIREAVAQAPALPEARTPQVAIAGIGEMALAAARHQHQRAVVLDLGNAPLLVHEVDVGLATRRRDDVPRPWSWRRARFGLAIDDGVAASITRVGTPVRE